VHVHPDQWLCALVGWFLPKDLPREGMRELVNFSVACRTAVHNAIVRHFTMNVGQRSVAVLLSATVMATTVATGQVARLNAMFLLGAYDRGDYSTVTNQLKNIEEVRLLDQLDADLKKNAKAWIGAAGPSERRRRAFMAGALALDVTQALIERESWANTNRHDSHAVNPEALLEVRQLIADEGGPPDALEHEWTLAQLATWEQWNRVARMDKVDAWLTPEPVWAILLGEPPLVQFAGPQSAFGRGGYLAEVLDRFPREPRLLLAVAEGHESLATRCAWQYCFDEMNPAILDDMRKRSKVRPPAIGDSHAVIAQRTFAFASANLKALDRLLPIAADFASIANAYPAVRAEASVHMGYLAIRAARPDAALAPLATAAESADPYVRYLADFFTGRALEQLERRADAIAAYRRALATVPNAPSAATLLAAQLFLSEDAADREDSHAVLEASNATRASSDPWDRYWYGDARLWPVYMEHLRQELRK
jgi:hypothetical protein